MNNLLIYFLDFRQLEYNGKVCGKCIFNNPNKTTLLKKMKAYLVLNNHIFHLKKKTTKIGRKLDNNFVIQDPLISRNHAEITMEGDDYYLKDLDSTGGTFLNNKKILKTKLFSGDIIMLTNVPILFVIDKKMVYSQGNINTGALTD